MALLLKHQTPEELISRFREAYRNAEKERVIQLARGVQAQIQAGNITETQVRNAFGYTQTQWNQLKTRFQNYVNADNTVKSAIGE